MTWMTWPRTVPRRDLTAWAALALAPLRHPVAALRRGVAALMTSEPRTSPGRRGVGLDVLLAVAATIEMLHLVSKSTATACQVSGGFSQCSTTALPTQPGHHIVILIAMMTTLPLALRRRYPLTIFWVIMVASVLAPHLTDNVITLGAILLAAYSAVVHSRFRLAAWVSVPLAGLVVASGFPMVLPPGRLPGRVFALLGLLPVLYVGQAVQQWRSRARESQARLERLQAEHEAATALALAAERARIASELHDVVTHNVSVMIVQAGAARHVLTDSPGAATDALLAVESSGRAAMAELRHLLGLLSPVADGEDSALAAGQNADQLHPQPGLRQLQSLTDRVRAAGLEVELRSGVAPPDLPPGLDLTAYRVIQEALTNVLKHAGAAQATVSVDRQRDRLAVCVSDPGARQPGPGPGSALRADAAVPGTGRGLLGLRERVALYGGELTAGPLPGGGWQVRASLPLDPDRGGAGPAGWPPGTAGVWPASASCP
jgi:signal transduction histidine kinase